LLVYRFDAPLFFINADRFRERLRLMLEENPGEEEWVILDFEGIGEVDATALDVLADLAAALTGSGIELGVARANERALDRLRRAGLTRPEGPLSIYPTINGAVRAFRSRSAG
jgi:MFS superfamily sulfate permease-like transporter